MGQGDALSVSSAAAGASYSTSPIHFTADPPAHSQTSMQQQQINAGYGHQHTPPPVAVSSHMPGYSPSVSTMSMTSMSQPVVMSQAMPMSSQGGGLPSMSQAGGMTMTSQSGGMGMTSQSGGMAMTSQSGGMTMTSQGGGMPIMSQAGGMPMTSQTGGMSSMSQPVAMSQIIGSQVNTSPIVSMANTPSEAVVTSSSGMRSQRSVPSNLQSFEGFGNATGQVNIYKCAT